MVFFYLRSALNFVLYRYSTTQNLLEAQIEIQKLSQKILTVPKFAHCTKQCYYRAVNI
jgi:hypothetical protein